MNFKVLRAKRKKKVFLNRLKPILIAASIIFITALIWVVLTSTSSVSNFNFLSLSASSLKSTDNRVNILLLGNGGGLHEGADLTDSIIVASYNLKTKKAVLISIPRDMWLDGPKLKINAVYENGDGQKLKYAEDKIDDILGIPIHYGIRLDFSGFSKAIDLVGGVDVPVESTFDDYQYPIEGKEDDLCGYSEKEVSLTDDQIKDLSLPSGQTDFQANVPKKVLVGPTGQVATDSANLDFPCRYEHIHYDKGLSHMDGETALKFVRSRHALGQEGSDFARSKRQQLVIQAFRQKALSLQTLSDPKKITGLISTFGQSFETDIPANVYLELYNLTKDITTTDNVVLGDSANGRSLLVNPPPSQYGAWVLIPPNNDFTQIQQFLQDKLNGVVPSPSPSPTPSPQASGKK